MKSNSYLFFNGECEAAFAFYAQCLDGNIIQKMTNGESPKMTNCESTRAEQPSPEWSHKIMHICLSAGDFVIMGADAPPTMFEKPQGFYVHLQFDSVAEGEKVYQRLAENGVVRMPFQETFWAKGFAMLTDRFGTPWLINCVLSA